MKKTSILFTFLMASINCLIAQSGSSTVWDAKHAFDDSKGGGSLGFGAFILLLIVFFIALFLWGKVMNKNK